MDAGFSGCLEGGLTVKFTIAVLVFSFSTFLAAAEEQGLSSISGVVKDPAGALVSGAAVRLHPATASTVDTTYSNRDGHYSFPSLAPGTYLIEATSKGLSVSQPIQLELKQGTEQSVDLQLDLTAQTTQVSVTAAAMPQSIDLVAKALDVVNVNEAERRGVFSVPDALQQVAGLRVITRGGPGSFTNIQTRGLRVQDTAILIDGFRFRDSTATQADASSFISDLFLIDSSRIEVVRGSGSSLYGTNSVAGMVNIITDQGGGPIHGDVDGQGGGLGLGRGVARVAGGALQNRILYSGGFSYLNETEGVNQGGAARNWSGQGGASVALTPTVRVSGRLFFDSDYLQFQTLPYPVGDSASTIIPAIAPPSSQIALANAGLPFDTTGATFVPNLNDPDARRNGSFVSGLFQVEQQVHPRFSWRVAYQPFKTHRDNIDGPSGPGFFQPLYRTSDLYDGRLDTLQGRADWIAAPWQVITAGYEFERESYDNFASDANPDPGSRAYSLINVTQRSNSVFAQDQLQLLNGRLLVLLSGRYQGFHLATPRFTGGSSPYSGITLPSPASAYTGDASLAYFIHKTSTKLRAHVGNAFRQPSLYERFGTFFYGGFFTPYGDPRLSPERAISTDGGIDQYIWRERLRVSGTFFYTHLQQVIAFDTFGLITPDTDPYGRFGGYFNTGGGSVHGVELSGEFRPTRRTSLRAAYTYTNSRNKLSQFTTATGNNPIQTPRILPHTVTFAATQDLTRRLQVGADFVGGSDFLYPLYGLAYRFEGPRQLGVSANYTVPLSDRLSMQLYTRVWNALDQRYFEDAFQTPRRWAIGGIRVSF
jgi:vitamin B12 transporter